MKTITRSELLDTARKTFRMEAEAIRSLEGKLSDDFETAVWRMAEASGRVVFTAIGKSAIIAQKIVATFNSTGTPALFMHAGEAIHGDLGMIQPGDIVVCLSKSGESPEIKLLVPLLKHLGNTLVAIVGSPGSLLARQADLVLDTSVDQEACPNNLAPTASTTAQLAMGDALAVCLMQLNGFSPADFAKFHPGGALGKKLYLRVDDLSVQNEKPSVTALTPMKEVILEITRKRLGMTVVAGDGDEILGIITDGDLRRMLNEKPSWELLRAADVMHRNPRTISGDELAVTALEIMRKNNITQLIVLKDGRYEGVIHLHDLIREGLI